MTYLEQLRERRSASKATEQKLRLFARLDEVHAVLVVEGEEDSNLYTDAFNKVIDGKVARVIICNGKGGVLGLRDFADANFVESTKLMFFIDRDHDEFIGLSFSDERTYITDHYSIEWNACTEEVIFALIARHYALSANDPVWEIVKAKFEELMACWVGHAMPVMQGVIVARRNGQHMDLEQILLSDICRINGSTIDHTGLGMAELLAKAGCTNCPDAEELSDCQDEVSELDHRHYVRGKLVVQFFCGFFKKLSAICGSPEKIDGQGLETGVQIGKNNFFRFVLGDWQIPASLRAFFLAWRDRQSA